MRLSRVRLIPMGRLDGLAQEGRVKWQMPVRMLALSVGRLQSLFRLYSPRSNFQSPRFLPFLLLASRKTIMVRASPTVVYSTLR